MTIEIHDRPITDPSAWRASDLAVEGEWRFELTLDEIDELAAAAHAAMSLGAPLEATRRDDFPVPTFGARIEQMRRVLEGGRGVVFVTGLPIHSRFSEEETSFIYWGIGQHLGRAVPQNDRGHLLGHVVDKRELGISVDPDRREYESNGPLEMHNDQSDVVGLLCFRRSISGGESTLASASEIHNVMRAERPDLLRELYGTFYMDRKKEELPGALPYYTTPVFSVVDGMVSARVSASMIRGAQKYADVPPLTPRQSEALAMIDEIANRPGMLVEMQLEEGDMQFVNNYVVIHGRRAYVDHDELALRRHMLRLWLALHDGRPLTPEFAARRDGIPQPVR